MRILFCSHNPLDSRLGAPKAVIELADELEKIGWQCRLASDEEICPGIRRLGMGIRSDRAFCRALSHFLEKNAKDFDVVDYDHRLLPYPRRRFAPSTLLVARVPLLVHHFERIAIPRVLGVRPILGLLVKGPYRRLEVRLILARANRTLENADLINVSNDRDRVELVSQGFDPGKIDVLPLGLTQARMESFVSRAAPKNPRVAFVGTFDFRKGEHDFPAIVGAISDAVPECKFRLLGVRRSEELVRRSFPKRLRSRLEIYPDFQPDDLPRLLENCSVGIFPSYVEGFGFGVLEMLAASLPVIAYDAPGPPVMLGPEHLVQIGEARAMASKVVDLLTNPKRLASERVLARTRAQDFVWPAMARLTSDVYSARVAARAGRRGAG